MVALVTYMHPFRHLQLIASPSGDLKILCLLHLKSHTLIQCQTKSVVLVSQLYYSSHTIALFSIYKNKTLVPLKFTTFFNAWTINLLCNINYFRILFIKGTKNIQNLMHLYILIPRLIQVCLYSVSYYLLLVTMTIQYLNILNKIYCRK